MFRKFLNLIVYLFAIIGLSFVIGLIISPYDFDYLCSRFSADYSYLQSQKEPIQYDIPTNIIADTAGEFNLTGNNSFVLDLGKHNISVLSGIISYKAFYHNPNFSTILHPLRYTFADIEAKVGDGEDFNCIQILSSTDRQDNPNGCKIFTINTGLLGYNKTAYNKLYIYITALKGSAKIKIN